MQDNPMAWPERTYWATVREHFTFTKDETRRLLVSIFFMAFIISFARWGPGQTFNLVYGLRNFASAILISAFSLFVYIGAQRLFAIAKGYQAEYEFWKVEPKQIFIPLPTFYIGIIIGLILILVSNGRLWFVAFGGVLVHHLAAHRLGWYRYQINYKDWAMVALMGPLASLFLALIFKSLTNIAFFQDNVLIPWAITVNVVFAIENMLPIPGLDGGRIFFGSRLLWIFGLIFILASSALLFFVGAIAAVISAIVLAAIIWFIWAIFVEKV